MAAKQSPTERVRAAILQNPSATVSSIENFTGASRRTVYYVLNKLRKEGLIPSSRKDKPATEEAKEPTVVTSQIIDDPTLQAMANSENFDEDFGTEDEVRAKLLRVVQKMAFDPLLHPDTRLSASQVWAKLKDIARSKDLGPGPPRTEDEIIDRLVRLMQGVGPGLVIKALDQAFAQRKDTSDEKAPDQQTPASPGATETPDSTGYDHLPPQTP
jgi:hypothetical protein